MSEIVIMMTTVSKLNKQNQKTKNPNKTHTLKGVFRTFILSGVHGYDTLS